MSYHETEIIGVIEKEGDIILNASFAEPAPQQPGTSVIVAVGIEVSDGNGTMKIVECFV